MNNDVEKWKKKDHLIFLPKVLKMKGKVEKNTWFAMHGLWEGKLDAILV